MSHKVLRDVSQWEEGLSPLDTRTASFDVLRASWAFSLQCCYYACVNPWFLVNASSSKRVTLVLLCLPYSTVQRVLHMVETEQTVVYLTYENYMGEKVW